MDQGRRCEAIGGKPQKSKEMVFDFKKIPWKNTT